MMKNKIVLADDHQFLLEGIITILKEEPSFEICGTAHNGPELLAMVKALRPDLAIVDLNMPGIDGLQCLKTIKAEMPQTKVLVLTNYSQPELIEEVKRLEAEGFLVKNSSANELKSAIAAILAGGTAFAPAPTSKPLEESSYFFDEFLRKYQLTRREVEIIKLVGNEMSTKQIASTLFLSEFTITTHRRNIMRKLDTKNVAGLLNFARQHQLL